MGQSAPRNGDLTNGALWHRSAQRQTPANIDLLKLPPYAPELNPIEHVWDELREKFFHNRVFDSLDALEDQLALALKTLETDDVGGVKSIVAWPGLVAVAINLLTDLTQPPASAEAQHRHYAKR